MDAAAITVELPVGVYERLKLAAHRQNRTVPEIARDLIVYELTDLPRLPHEIEEELTAFEYLADATLLLLANGTLSHEHQQELARLNQKAQRGALSPDEVFRQDALIATYDEMLVRRAQAAAILKSRGRQAPIDGSHASGYPSARC